MIAATNYTLHVLDCLAVPTPPVPLGHSRTYAVATCDHTGVTGFCRKVDGLDAMRSGAQPWFVTHPDDATEFRTREEAGLYLFELGRHSFPRIVVAIDRF